MGIDLAPLVVADKREISDFAGRAIAIDAFNTIYQFLSVIRTPDGQPLKDDSGRVVSHLSGLLQRNTNLLSAGIRPVYVFDGIPHPLKMETLIARKARKEAAQRDYETAVKEGDMEKARRKAMQTTKITDEVITDSRAFLDAMGIPYLTAPSEGEAQASQMAVNGDVWAAGSQDFDTILFGAPRLVRNITISGRRKLPMQNRYVNVEPEVITLERVLKALEITREQLVDLAILVGTDFNDGVKGIGPKKGLKLIRKHETIEAVIEEKDLEVAGFEEVRKIFLEPEVRSDYELEWSAPDEEAVVDLLCRRHDFSEARVESSLRKVDNYRRSASQRSLSDFF